MEKIPAISDVELDNVPYCKAKGVDELLKRARKELLKQLDKKWLLGKQ